MEGQAEKGAKGRVGIGGGTGGEGDLEGLERVLG